jgi:hypothetical protein
MAFKEVFAEYVTDDGDVKDPTRKPDVWGTQFSSSLGACAHQIKSILRHRFRFLGWNEVADLIVERCAVPHSPFRVRQEFANAIA